MNTALVSNVMMISTLMLLIVHQACAMGSQNKTSDAQQRRSGHTRPVSSTPLPFRVDSAQDVLSPAISTGYYFVDSDDLASEPWRPSPADFIDTTIEPGTWKRVVSGPNQRPSSFWADPASNNYGGLAFFRNPGNALDSTDNAFAGPISIGFPFFFNGVRYDSFYVSTNGLVALSNRRYHYTTDAAGRPMHRDVAPDAFGRMTVYDGASDDLRPRSATANDTTDATPDDWGYRFVACGGQPSDAQAGIRSSRNCRLSDSALAQSWPVVDGGSSIRPALIAPCWDDMQLSAFDAKRGVADDFGRVYYKRSPAGDKLVISFVNLTPIGVKTAGFGPNRHSVLFERDNRPGDDRHYSVNVQVHLNRRDSSVSIHYGELRGSVRSSSPVPLPASDWIRCNATIGVHGGARRLAASHDSITVLDHDKPRYTQSTEYLVNDDTEMDGSVRAAMRYNESDRVPHSNLAIAFKQWKNILRVVDMYYRVRPLSNNAPLDFARVIPSHATVHYEALGGEMRLGAIQPVAIVQLLSNDIQGPRGVNYVRQGVHFKVRARIVNAATGKIVYSTSKVVTDAALRDSLLSGVQRCDVNGTLLPYEPAGTFVRPYEFIKVTFPPFEPTPFLDDQFGRLLMTIIAEPKDSLNNPIGDHWPFDDTLTRTMFHMRRLHGFADDVTEYHVLTDGPIIPAVLKWVSIGAEIVDGNERTTHAPPPTRVVQAANSDRVFLASPVIRLDRLDETQREIPKPGTYGGDELRSTPVDLTRKRRAALSFSVQRTGRTDRTSGFSDATLIGPEHRVDARGTTFADGFVRKPDELIVEFAMPTDDLLNNIANVSNWNVDLAGFGDLYTPPMRLFGGGGHVRGYDEATPDRQLDRTDRPGIGGLRIDASDDGKDEQWTKVYIPIPDTILRWKNYGALNFRFRFRLSCMNNADGLFTRDDADPFYLDNIKIAADEADAEVMDVRLLWPYTMTPSAQLRRVPVHVRVVNVGTNVMRDVDVDVLIRERSTQQRDLFHQIVRIDSLGPGQVVRIDTLRADLRTMQTGAIELRAHLLAHADDVDHRNDTITHHMRFLTGASIAYDLNPGDPVNNVGDQSFSGIRGLGLNIDAKPRGADDVSFVVSSPVMPFTQFTPAPTFLLRVPGGLSDASRYGTPGGDRSGQIAVRYVLPEPDTLKGYEAFWASINGTPDPVRYAVYPDSGGRPASKPVAGSIVERGRGLDELGAQNEYRFDAMTVALLDHPIVLSPGTYWVSVAQLGQSGFALGASASRSGMVTTRYADIHEIGDRTISVPIDHDLRALFDRDTAGLGLAAIEHDYGSGDWSSFTPEIGPGAYAHHNAVGSVGSVLTFTQGSWIPLLRPYFGPGRGSIVEKPSDDVQIATTTFVAGHPPTVDAEGTFELLVSHPAPNPTSGPVHFTVQASVPTVVTVVVRDVLGTIIRTCDHQRVGATPVVLTWDGRTDLGERVAAGHYTVHCMMPNGTVTRSVSISR